MNDQIYIIFECIYDRFTSEERAWEFIRNIPFICKITLSIFHKHIDKFLINREISIPNLPDTKIQLKSYPNYALEKRTIYIDFLLRKRIVVKKNKSFVIMTNYTINHQARKIKIFWTYTSKTAEATINILIENKLINIPYRIIDKSDLLKYCDNPLHVNTYYSILTENYYYEFSGGALHRYGVRYDVRYDYKYYGIVRTPINNLDDFHALIIRFENRIKKNNNEPNHNNNNIANEPQKYLNSNKFHYLRN